MTDPLPAVASLRTLEDSDLAADLRRDLGADTLFFICAIEAALGVEHVFACDPEAAEEVEQLSAPLFEDAA